MIDFFKKDYELQYRDMNAKSKLTIPSLLNYLLYTSILHEAQMRSEGRTQDEEYVWILNQWNVNTYSMPGPSEVLTIETQAVAFTKLYALRKFTAYNEKREMVAEADTYWLLMDVKNRKLRTLTEETAKIWDGTISEKVTRPLKLKPKDDYEDQFVVKVGNLNIDMVNHVYNICYIEWALNYISFEVLNEYRLENMVVSYIKETYLYENITVSTKCIREENGIVKYFHKFSKSDDTIACLIESQWKK